MSGFLTDAGTLIIRVIFELYILLVMLRFILQTVRADFYNPLSQFIVKATSPVLKPLRRVIPGFAGIDLAAIVLMLTLKIIELLLIGLLHGGLVPIAVVLLGSVFGLLETAIYIYIVAIIVLAIASWISTGGYNPVLALMAQITDPLVRPIRRMIPPMSGFDLSPLVALVLLNLLLLALNHLFRSLFGA
jgi:YggT family protein